MRDNSIDLRTRAQREQDREASKAQAEKESRAEQAKNAREVNAKLKEFEKEFDEDALQIDAIYTEVNQDVKDIMDRFENGDLEKYPKDRLTFLNAFKGIAEADLKNPEIHHNAKEVIKESVRSTKNVEKAIRRLEAKIEAQKKMLDKVNLSKTGRAKAEKVIAINEEKVNNLRKGKEGIENQINNAKNMLKTPNIIRRQSEMLKNEMSRLDKLIKSSKDNIENFMSDRKTVGILAYDIKNQRDTELLIENKIRAIREKTDYIRDANNDIEKSLNANIFQNINRAIRNVGRAAIGKEDLTKEDMMNRVVAKKSKRIDRCKKEIDEMKKGISADKAELKKLFLEDAQRLTISQFKTTSLNLSNIDNERASKIEYRAAKRNFFDRDADKYTIEKDGSIRTARDKFNDFKELYKSGEYNAPQLRVLREAITQGYDLKDIANPNLEAQNMAIVLASKKYDIEYDIDKILETQEKQPLCQTINDLYVNPVYQDFVKDMSEKSLDELSKNDTIERANAELEYSEELFEKLDNVREVSKQLDDLEERTERGEDEPKIGETEPDLTPDEPNLEENELDLEEDEPDR